MKNLRLFPKSNLLKKPPNNQNQKQPHRNQNEENQRNQSSLSHLILEQKNDFYIFRTLWQEICETKTCPHKLNLSWEVFIDSFKMCYVGDAKL